MDIMGLIARAPWREAMTYRDSWPHEYVVVKKDGQEALLAAFCARIAAGEGVECEFFNQGLANAATQDQELESSPVDGDGETT